MNEKDNSFRIDLIDGLSRHPKRISSKYFYDNKGDALFQQIMELPAYYLSQAEDSILEKYSNSLANALNTGSIELLELGAGDGRKTKRLLRELLQVNTEMIYRPMDISAGVLKTLEARLQTDLPGLKCESYAGDYWQQFPERKADRQRHILFLGSNLGNYAKDVEKAFLQRLYKMTLPGDRLILGLDLVKDPSLILKAYDDPQGITSDFNLNLINRINRELDGDFDPEGFVHWAVYDPLEQEARSYLISKRKATYSIDNGQRSFSFNAWEPIHVETSRKYNLEELPSMAKENGFKMIEAFTLEPPTFTDVLWERV